MFLLLSLAAVVPPPPEAVICSVAYVRADPDGVGTGFVVAGDPPRLVTCRHVLGERKTADVFFPRFDNGGRVRADRTEVLAERDDQRKSGLLVVGKVVASSDELDLAVLELPELPAGVTGLSLTRSVPAAGAPVWSIGCRGDQETLWNVARGVVRQAGPLRDGYFWQGKKLAIDAPGLSVQLPVEEGDSGGPVLNDLGEVVAVMSAVRRRVPGTAIGPDANAVRAMLKRAEPKEPPAVPDRLTRATVWISPTATDRRTAGVIVDLKRRWVLTSNKGVGSLDRVGVAFPLFDKGKAVGDRDAYRDPVSLHLSGHWTTGTVIARDVGHDLAVIELDRMPEFAVALPFAEGEPRVGADVRAISHPAGLEFVFAHSNGSVRQHGNLKLSRDGNKVPVTVLQLPAQSTAAGGPIVNEAGELLGILAATDAPVGIGYAVATIEARAFVNSAGLYKFASSGRFLASEFGSLRAVLAHLTPDADTALSLNPDNLRAQLQRASSVADWDRIVERHPQFAPALRGRAAVYLLKTEPKSAQSDVQRILDVDPADADARLLSARAYAAAGEEPKAATEFANTLRVSPKTRTAVLLAIERHADELDKKGLTTAGDWLLSALTAVAKVLPPTEMASHLKRLPADPKERARYLRTLCRDP